MRKWTYLALLMCAAAPAAFAADSVTVQKPVSINDDADVPQAVLDECKLDSEVPDAVAAKAKEAGVTTMFADKVSGSEKGRTLLMEITDVVSDGNAFLGHHKSMTVRGKLYQDGNVVATFRDRRNSMGGAFGGFKGNCAVLARTAKAIGEDIGEWLAAPKMDARLGDLE
ncbi:MAG: hypothetical protein ACTHOL_08475 [Luteibacter jiangsuensis]